MRPWEYVAYCRFGEQLEYHRCSCKQHQQTLRDIPSIGALFGPWPNLSFTYFYWACHTHTQIALHKTLIAFQFSPLFSLSSPSLWLGSIHHQPFSVKDRSWSIPRSYQNLLFFPTCINAVTRCCCWIITRLYQYQRKGKRTLNGNLSFSIYYNASIEQQ